MLVVPRVLRSAHRTQTGLVVSIFEEIDFEKTSVGEALKRLQANGTLCTGPLGHHSASDDAIAAGVEETRCLSCRRRIVRGENGWRER